jgi:hypothetical protein
MLRTMHTWQPISGSPALAAVCFSGEYRQNRKEAIE